MSPRTPATDADGDRAAEALAVVAGAAKLLSAAPDQAVQRLTQHAAERLGVACAVELAATGDAPTCVAGEPSGAQPDLRLPLEADGELLGALAVWTGGRPLPADHRLALETIAGMLVCALEHAALRKQVLDADAARDEALSIASHEFRSPLTALKMVVDTSLRRARSTADVVAPDWVAQKFEMAGRQVEHMTRLVHRLLDASRISAGYIDLEVEEVDFAAVLREVVDRSCKELEWARCTWTLSAPDELVGRWDRLRLDQIATNLLANAMRFGRGKPIAIALEADASAARLSVSDQGLGIEPTDHGRLFRKFERLGRPRGMAGFGLGLWVTRQLVDALGGTIAVHSTPGEGATFIVELPRGTGAALPRELSSPGP